MSFVKCSRGSIKKKAESITPLVFIEIYLYDMYICMGLAEIDFRCFFFFFILIGIHEFSYNIIACLVSYPRFSKVIRMP